MATFQVVSIRPRPGSLSALRREAKQAGLRGFTRRSKEELQEDLNRTAPRLNKSDLKSRGWTETAIAKFLGEPDSTRQNRRYRSAAPVKLYRKARVELAEASPEFQAWRSRRLGRPPANQMILAEPQRPHYVERWPDWRDALPIACDHLFLLNRYAKSKACSGSARQRIYAAKGRMIELLHRRGDCVACHLHERRRLEEPCWGCNGTGKNWDVASNNRCLKCDGSGDNRIKYYHFGFQVGDVYYSWHQPVDKVDFSPTLTAETQKWIDRTEVPAVELGGNDVQDYLDLLEWLLRQSEKDGAAQRLDG